MNNCEIIFSVIIGIVTGIISGFIVYWLTKRREKTCNSFYYWEQFLFNSLQNYDVKIQVELLNRITEIAPKDSEWHKTVTKIIQSLYKDEENTVYSKEESEIIDDIVKAIRILYKFKEKHNIK